MLNEACSIVIIDLNEEGAPPSLRMLLPFRVDRTSIPSLTEINI